MNITSTSKDCRGQTLTEYMILLLLVAIVGLTAVKQFGRAVHQRIDKARDEIQKL